MTVAELQAKRDELLEALAATKGQVRFGDRSITYRDPAALEAALNKIDAEIARASSSDSRQFVIQTSRGLQNG